VNLGNAAGLAMSRIDIFTRQFCGYCVMAKNLLEEKGVEYSEFDATFSPEIRRQMIERANGRTTFPQIFIDEFHVGGCTELLALEREGKLDALLEPGIV
jgi:glutaredoxin 3